MIRRQIGEQFDHGGGQLVTAGQQVLHQIGLFKNFQNVGILGQFFDIEHIAHGISKDQIFGQSRV